MAHALSTVNNEVAMAYNKELGVPWHGLGTPLEGLSDLDSILKAAHLDWTVKTRPVYDENGNELPKYREIYFVDKDRKEHHIAVTTTRYRPIQNDEFFGLLDRLIGKGHKVWDTAGAIFNFKKVFGSIYLHKVPGLITELPNGEKLDKYLVGINSHDGSSRAKIFLTTIRPVCKNTLDAGLFRAGRIWLQKHVFSGDIDVQVIRDSLNLQFSRQKLFEEVFAKRQSVELTPRKEKRFLDAFFDLDETNNKSIQTRYKLYRESISEYTKYSPGNDRDKLTLWSLYNGFTWFLDHDYGYRTNQATTFLSTMDGKISNMRQKAVEVLSNLAK